MFRSSLLVLGLLLAAAPHALAAKRNLTVNTETPEGVMLKVRKHK